jgi:hypothetical protein
MIVPEVLSDVVELVKQSAEVKGTLGQKVIDQDALRYDHLRNAFLQDPDLRDNLIPPLTYVRNIAISDLRGVGSLSISEKAGRALSKVVGQERSRVEVDSLKALISTMPGILNYLADHADEIDYAPTALEKLKEENKKKKNLLPDDGSYVYSTTLLGKMMLLANALPKQV